jgi:hypothetical protein
MPGRDLLSRSESSVVIVVVVVVVVVVFRLPQFCGII